MNKSIFRNILAVGAAVLTAPSLAADGKTFIGSTCSFADNPLASHSKQQHRFTNTSGGPQWVTCPIVRDSLNKSIEFVSMDTAGEVSYVRLEQRGPGNGSLTGWNSNGATNLNGSGLQHYWFSGGVDSGGNINGAALALEIRLSNAAYVNMYHVSENN